MPKLTKSVKESNSLPNSDVPFINLAILPSNASAKVKILGNKYLVFFEVTNLNFLFSSITQRLANFLLLQRFDQV